MWHLALDLDSLRFSQRCFCVNQKIYTVAQVLLRGRQEHRMDLGLLRRKYSTMSQFYIITHLIPQQQLESLIMNSALKGF